MWAWQPHDEYVVQFLKIMKNPANRPVFVHCYTGGDRVGLFVAVYRVAFCGWTKTEAEREMLYGGGGFHQILIKYLVPYFDSLDIDAVMRRAGMTDTNLTQNDRKGAMPRPILPSREGPTNDAANAPPDVAVRVWGPVRQD